MLCRGGQDPEGKLHWSIGGLLSAVAELTESYAFTRL